MKLELRRVLKMRTTWLSIGIAVLLSAAVSFSVITTPFLYYEGYTRDAADNLVILIFLLVLICAVIVSTVFSAEYQSGSDDILRCTRYGKVRLAVTKLCASLLIVFAMFAVCAAVYVFIVNGAFGWGSLQSSAQILSTALNFVPLTVGQEQGLAVLEGLLTLLAVASFTLFLSAKCQNSATSLVIAFSFCLLPVVLHNVGKGNLIDLLVCLFPAGGAGLNTGNFYYQMNGTTFLRIGPLSVWAPYLMLGAVVVEIPLFFVLAVRTYCRHRAS